MKERERDKERGKGSNQKVKEAKVALAGQSDFCLVAWAALGKLNEPALLTKCYSFWQ